MCPTGFPTSGNLHNFIDITEKKKELTQQHRKKYNLWYRISKYNSNH
jgi:hypothetical protein